MSRQRIKLGKNGEDIAAYYLTEKGFEIIDRNHRNKFGEIDIIALEGKTYVFVEVKTRSNHHFGNPEEAVTLSKQKQICKTAEGYLLFKKLLDTPARFDVIGITITNSGPEINHIISAFDAL